MQTIITSNISRLGLHDSSFEKIIRNDDELELIFDWATFDNLDEKNVTEPIVIGKTSMFLTGVNSEEFRVYTNQEKYSLTRPPEKLSKYLYTISSNKIDDINRTVEINGLYRENDNEMYDWIEWIFGFETCRL